MTDTGALADYKWDIFLSYASEDRDWVLRELYYPLLQCVDDAGKTPAIFYDNESLPLGEDIMVAISDAVLSSRHLIAVISPAYFDPKKSGWTSHEFSVAYSPNPTGRSDRLKVIPILKEKAALDSFTRRAGPSIHLLDTSAITYWRDRLFDNLKLHARTEIAPLRFETTINDCVVNHTIPSVAIALPAGAIVDTVVELTAPDGILQGTLKRNTVKGKAEFSDLSFVKEVRAVRITASASGYKFADSNPFSVIAQKKIELPPPSGGDTSAPHAYTVACGPAAQVHFFETGKGFVVMEPEPDGVRCSVYSLDAKRTGEAKTRAPVKSIATSGDTMALADWTGLLTIINDGGGCTAVDLCPHERAFQVPGECRIIEGAILAGLWNGDLLRIVPSGEKETLFNHSAGVQCLAANAAGIYLTDFNGMFCDFRDRKLARSFPVERLQAGMHSFPNFVLIAGEKRLYQYRCDRAAFNHMELPSVNILHAMSASSRMITIDQKGRGIFIDEQLRFHAEFHVAPGARPLCQGERDKCTYVSFIYPDGAGALLKNSQIVYTHAMGMLSFDRELRSVAVRTETGISILDYSWLPKDGAKVSP